jgi:hypothetical protein
MTIVVGWEKGVVRAPSRWKTVLFGLNLAENWVFAAPLMAFGYMLTLWYRKGKDPDTGDPLVAAYGPPDENGRPLLPAEIGALIDEALDPKDLTASVIDLAVKKHLSIEERKTPGLIFEKTDYALRKLKEAGPDLPPFERLLMERIFRDHGAEVTVSDLKLSFYKNLDALKDAAFEGETAVPRRGTPYPVRRGLRRRPRAEPPGAPCGHRRGAVRARGPPLRPVHARQVLERGAGAGQDQGVRGDLPGAPGMVRIRGRPRRLPPGLLPPFSRLRPVLHECDVLLPRSSGSGFSGGGSSGGGGGGGGSW